MAKSVEDRGRGARMARRDEGAYCGYVTEEQRRQPGCLGREIDRLSHSRALSGGPPREALRAASVAADTGRVHGHIVVVVVSLRGAGLETLNPNLQRIDGGDRPSCRRSSDFGAVDVDV